MSLVFWLLLFIGLGGMGGGLEVLSDGPGDDFPYCRAAGRGGRSQTCICCSGAFAALSELELELERQSCFAGQKMFGPRLFAASG